MYYTIYKTTNLLNGNIYIGFHITDDLSDNYLGSGKILKLAIAKYGKENFKKEILHIFDNEIEMKAKEKELVTEDFCNCADTYNLCDGGKGGFSYINRSGIAKFKGKHHSDETKAKIAEAAKGNKKLLGYKHTEETLLKMGIKSSEYWSGRPKSEEHKKNISISLKNINLCDEEKEKRQENIKKARNLKPEKVSDNTKLKISQALREAYANGTRQKSDRDWNAIQSDIDIGLSRKHIYEKYEINRHIFYYGLEKGYLKK